VKNTTASLTPASEIREKTEILSSALPEERSAIVGKDERLIATDATTAAAMRIATLFSRTELYKREQLAANEMETKGNAS
jgi:hypothetical protein